jgi:hypothetical protein
MYVHEVIPLMEGLVGTMTAGSTKKPTTRVTAWVEGCKAIMRMPQHRGLSDWAFKCMPDVDESADLVEAAGTLYAALAGYVDEAKDLCVVFEAGGDTSLTVTGATDILGLYVAQITCPMVATAGTEEYTGAIWPGGILGSTDLMVGADTTDSTTVATDDCRVWVLYRTNEGLLA